jgi:hypothetical protein
VRPAFEEDSIDEKTPPVMRGERLIEKIPGLHDEVNYNMIATGDKAAAGDFHSEAGWDKLKIIEETEPCRKKTFFLSFLNPTSRN